MKELTHRQKEVLTFIADFIRKNTYPPTVRETAEHFEMSVKGAHDHIIALRKKGYLKHTGNKPRTLGVIDSKYSDSSEVVRIPILGSVAAGLPLLSEENLDGSIIMHKSLVRKGKKYFALRVKGDSMTGAGIFEGDLAIIEKQSTVKNGEIAVAVLDDAITLKKFYKESTRIRLQSENPAYKPIYSQDVKIVGRLTGIIRNY
ncbi:MAG: transcriptional repressor LexA [Treponema sp.]|jgi:repressor LexA|nr:transcriptional repressor LexA [Treponema sp.]